MSVVESVRRLFGREDGHWPDVEPIRLTHGDIMDVLSSERRRLMLWYLVRDRDGEASLSDIADHVAHVENELDPDDQLSNDQRQRVYVGIYQGHLPKLVDLGVVEFDDQRNIVTAAPIASTLVDIDRGVASVAREPPA